MVSELSITNKYRTLVTKIVSIYMIVLLVYSLGDRISYIHTIWYDVVGGTFKSISLSITLKDLIYILGFPILFLILHYIRNTLIAMDTLCIAIYSIIIITISITDISIDVFQSIKSSIYIIIPLMISYYFIRLLTEEEIRIFLKRAIIISTSIWSVGCVISLIYYFTNYQANYYFGNAGWSNPQGMALGRLYGCFSDPNYAAIYSLLIIVGLMYLLITQKNTFQLKLFYSFCIFTYVSYIVLSGSRTCYVTVFVIVVVVCFHYTLSNKTNSGFIKDLIRFILGVLVAFLSLIILYIILLNSYKLIGSLITPDRLNDEFIRTNIDGGVVKAFDSDRFEIWGNYLEIWKDSPLFGFSPDGALNYAKINYPWLYISYVGLLPHSMFIQILTQSGIIGFFSLCYVMFIPCLRFVKIYFHNRKTIPYTYGSSLWSLR